MHVHVHVHDTVHTRTHVQPHHLSSVNPSPQRLITLLVSCNLAKSVAVPGGSPGERKKRELSLGYR